MKKNARIFAFICIYLATNAFFLSNGNTSEFRALWDVECKYNSDGDLTGVTCHIDGQYECNCPTSMFEVETQF